MKTTLLKFKKRNAVYYSLLLCAFIFSSYKAAACTANFTYTAGLNGHYTFTSTSTGVDPGTSYRWNPGNGSGWQFGTTTFACTYTANATYSVELAIFDTTGLCNDTVTIPITVSNVVTPCLLSAGFNVMYGSGGQVTFTSTSTGTNANTLYYWSPGDSNQRVQGSNVFSHTYLWDGNYYVWLTVYDTGSAYCIDSTEVEILVQNADSSNCHLNVNFTYTLDTNGQVTFNSTTTGTAGLSLYTWNMGDTTGHFSGYNDTSLVYTYAYNGTYSVTLYVNSDTSLCSDSITMPVTITNACDLNVNFTYQYDSSGQVMFTSTSAGVNTGAQYNWSFGDNTVNASGYDTATHGYSFIGNYNVTLTIVNPGGCTSSSTQSIYIYNKDSLQARFVYSAAGDSIYDTLPGLYYFTSTSLGTNANTYYKWTPGDGDPSDSGLGMTTYQHTYLANGPYDATLTIWYTILPRRAVIHSSAGTGRYDESSYTLVVNVTTATTGISSVSHATIYTVYPNPNNGSFHIAVNGLADEKDAEIRISNIMGQVIYQSNAVVKNGSTLNDINLPDVANGIYLLQIITSGNTYTSRIAIQR